MGWMPPRTDPSTPPADLPQAAARAAVEAASDRQATDVVLLDVRGAVSFADYVVVMSAGSARQSGALADAVEEAVERTGLKRLRREGTNESGWVLLDFVDVVVHILSEEQRAHYRLEQVWKQAKPLLRIQ
jgi:ribosome-associated protein